MENKYFNVTTSPLDYKTRHALNYSVIREDVMTNLPNSLGRSLQTREDYVLWVKQWRQVHDQIVYAIKYFRFMKNRYKTDIAFQNVSVNDCNSFYYMKKILGKIARDMYEMRNENKAWAKTLPSLKKEAA